MTIPQEIRNELGLLPHTEVEFEMAGDHAQSGRPNARLEQAPEVAERSKPLAVSPTPATSTDEIMALTRGEKPSPGA